MNMQAMLKQAQKMQKDIMKAQNEINEMKFEGKSSLVTVLINGKSEMIDCKIDVQQLEKDDVEMLQDMIVIAYNDAKKQLEQITEEKLGPYAKGMPGLF